MCSEIRQTKYRYIFNLLDFDKNGFIEKDDFIGVAENLCVVRGEELETEESQEIINQCENLWHGLASHIDENTDDRCTFNEWMLFIENRMVNAETDIKEAYLRPLVSKVFDLYDLNHDGYIALSEYLDIFLSFRLKSSLVGKSFNTLDENGDNSISKTELVDAVMEFILSDDLQDSGNFIFGDLYNTNVMA